jgi:outer membrane lipoprotein-sorting protein
MPAILAPSLLVSTILVNTLSAAASPVLPVKTTAEVIALMGHAPLVQYAGEVTKTANLGLPAINLVPTVSQASVNQMKKTLPKAMSDFIPKASVSGNLATVLGFLAGSQEANVFYNSPVLARVQILDQMSERDLVVNGGDVWFYDALQQTVLHASANPFGPIPSSDTFVNVLSQGIAALPIGVAVPSTVATFVVTRLASSTQLRLGATTVVAGRDAYQLVLTPRAVGTLVKSVVIAVDAQFGLPLAVTVNARHQNSPAFSLRFNTIHFGPNDPSLFAFTPPEGATVSSVGLPATAVTSVSDAFATVRGLARTAQTQVRSLASRGWATVVHVPETAAQQRAITALATTHYFRTLTKPVTGGRVFSTALFNVLFTNRGQIYVGAVTIPSLLAAITT